MITEDKILALYRDALEQSHPAPERAVFGRLGLSGGDPAFEDDKTMGLFAVSKKLLKSIGMDIVDNAEASFKAMIYFDTKHLSDTADVAQAMAQTSAEKDVDAYIKKIDASVAEFSDKIEWEANNPVRFKEQEKDVSDAVEEAGPLDDVDGIEEVKSEAKRLTAEAANQSREDVSLGLDVDAKAEYDRLIAILKGTIDHMI